MRIVRNERHIRVRSFLSRYASLAGLLVLVAALIMPIARPGWYVATVVAVGIGFVLVVVGGFFTDRYAGPLADHAALSAALKDLGRRYVLLQYVLPVSQVLLEPGGCTVFVVKTQAGRVVCEQAGRWKHHQRGKFFRQIVGQEGVGAPDVDARREVLRLERWLSARLPGVQVPVRGVVVFVNPAITLEVKASTVPVLHIKKLRDWLRGAEMEPLGPDVQEQLAQVLGATVAQEG